MRYEYDYSTGTKKKLRSKFSFPAKINLAAFSHRNQEDDWFELVTQ